MRFRTTKNPNHSLDTFQLTKQEIESQVLSDLVTYKRKFYEKYSKSASTPLDVDSYIKELWGFNICFENIEQDSEDRETLGYLRPEKQQVIVDENCDNQKRISFTLAHEAGHLSLHKSLFLEENGLIVGWRYPDLSGNKKRKDKAEIRREWQANTYAGALLAPKPEVEFFLEEVGLLRNRLLISFDLNEYFPKFEERFGLSRQALEIRLRQLGIPFTGLRYGEV